MSVSDRTLMAGALGVLDPGDALELGELLGPGEHLRQSGLAMLAEVSFPNALPAPRAERMSGGVLHGATCALRPGDRVSFALDWPSLPASACCAVFRRVDEQVRRLYPSGEQWTPLSRFRQERGRPLVQLVVEPPSGRQLLDIVLVAGELITRPWPDGSPVWELLHTGYLEGRAYGVTMEIDVL